MFNFLKQKNKIGKGSKNFFFWGGGDRNHSAFYIFKKKVEKVKLIPGTEENVEMENEQVGEGCEEMEINGGDVLVDKPIDELKEENYDEGEEREKRKEVNCSFLCFPDRW